MEHVTILADEQLLPDGSSGARPHIFNTGCGASEISSLIGDTVDLSCEIDEEKCGKIYYIDWSTNRTAKDWTRVYFYSKNSKEPRFTLANPNRAVMFTNSTYATLRISPVKLEDDGFYRCNVGYIGAVCAVFSDIKLLTLVIPGEPEITVDGKKVQGRSVVGPLLEDTEHTFACTSSGGKPSPVVLWSRKNQNVPGRPTWEVSPPGTVKASNTINMTVALGDLGTELTCIVEHNYTNTNYNTSIRIDVNVAPKWLNLRIDEGETKFIEGEDVVFFCRVPGAKPAAKITWFNGTERMRVQPSSNVSIFLPDGTYVTDSTLSFIASRYDHMATFVCQGNNIALKQKKENPLFKSKNIEVQYTPTVVIDPVEGLRVNETSPIKLSCAYESNPPQLLEVRWFINGESIENLDGAFERRDELSPPYLKITRTSRHDQGAYSCGIRNEIGWGNSTNEALVIVYYAPEVIAKVSPRTISEGKETSVTLSCLVTAANPEQWVYVRWYKNGIIMNQTTEKDIVWIGIDRSFSGNYSCQAKNIAGWGSISEPQLLDVYYAPGEAYLTASTGVPEKGQPLELTCTVIDYGNPLAKLYRWMKDGEPISETTTGNFTIAFISISDEGNYSCFASNIAGYGAPGHYFVKAYAPPFFIEQLPQIFGVKRTAEAVSMTCTVECDPLCNVEWYKDDQDLSDSYLYNIKTSEQAANVDRGYFKSIVTTLYWNLTAWPDQTLGDDLDRANFSCQSTANDIGIGVSNTTMFRVEYAPSYAMIYPNVANVTEDTVPNDILYCDTTGFPEPSIMWKFGDQIVSGEKALIMNYNITREKAGTYTCEASNRHGSAEASAEINVQYKPECLIVVSDADEDGLVNLTCRATANPLHSIHFTWTRNNETRISDPFFDEVNLIYYSRWRVQQGAAEYYGQYQCIANNSIGASEPCSFQITGAAPLLIDEDDNHYTIIIVIIVLIIILILIIIICCILCRRRAKNPNKMGKREGPTDGAEPTPPRPSDRSQPIQPVYQNVTTSTPKVKPMPRTKNKPIYENVQPTPIKPSDGPYRPDDDELVYADMYDDIKMGVIPDPRIKPSLPPKKTTEEPRNEAPSVQRPAPTSNAQNQPNQI